MKPQLLASEIEWNIWPPLARGTAAPTTDAHELGEIVWNSAPAPSGNIGWVCTTAGTPGAWKTFGVIQA